MARPRNWPPTLLRHSSGQARIRVNGHDYYLGPFGSDEAKQKYLQLVNELSADSVPKISRAAMTVAGLVARWLGHVARHYDPRGREPKAFAVAARPLSRLYGPIPAAEFGPKALRAVQRAMATGSWMDDEETKRYADRGYEIRWSRNHVNRQIVRLRTMFAWAESEELIPRGTTHALRTVPGIAKNDASVRQNKKRKPVSWEQVQKSLPHCPWPTGPMLEIQWWSAMRPGEVRIMRESDIDRSAPVWLYRPEHDKNEWRDGDIQPIPLGPECQRVLKRLLLKAEPGAHLFPTGKFGKHPHYTAFSYAQAVRRACIRAKIERFTPYQLRHAAKMRIQRAVNAEAARVIMRHKSIITTAHYGEADLERASELAAIVG